MRLIDRHRAHSVDEESRRLPTNNGCINKSPARTIRPLVRCTFTTITRAVISEHGTSFSQGFISRARIHERYPLKNKHSSPRNSLIDRLASPVRFRNKRHLRRKGTNISATWRTSTSVTVHRFERISRTRDYRSGDLRCK